MSTRAVRKKQAAQGITEKIASVSSSSEEEAPAAPKGNLFALLNQTQASEESSSDSEEIPSNQSKGPQSTKPAQAPKGKAKKKNQKKAKPQPEAQEIDNVTFDQILQEYGAPSILTNQQQTVSSAAFHLFEINPKCLNANEELKKLFGTGFNPKEKDTKEKAKPVRQPRGQRGVNPHANNPHAMQNKPRPARQRNTNLVKCKNSWPALNNWLQMEVVDSEAGIDYFKVVWSADYKRSQQQFYDAVQTGDPNSLAMLLQESPYQVDTMLQLVEACKQTGELDMAVDLIERIIYRWETLWHPLFNPLKSHNVRFEYEHETNRSFFMALFRHIQMLNRRGCLRTALEFCKLVLSIDHSDPLGLLLWIDIFCLKTSEHVYLLELYYNNDLFRLSEGKANQAEELELLPNFLFSVALAKFHIEQSTGLEVEDFTLPSGKKVSSADSLLQHAIIMFPSIIMPLCNKIGVTTLPGKSGDDLLFHELFSATQDYDKLTLINQLVILYINRSQAAWKESQVSRWLKKNVTIVVDKFIAGDPMFANCKAMVLEHYADSKISTSTSRHILLSEEEEALQTLPADVVREGVRIYDDEGQPQAPPERNPGNPMLLFLQSLLPWFDPNTPAENQQQILQQLAQQFQWRDDEDD